VRLAALINVWHYIAHVYQATFHVQIQMPQSQTATTIFPFIMMQRHSRKWRQHMISESSLPVASFGMLSRIRGAQTGARYVGFWLHLVFLNR